MLRKVESRHSFYRELIKMPRYDVFVNVTCCFTPQSVEMRLFYFILSMAREDNVILNVYFVLHRNKTPGVVERFQYL